MAESQIGGSHSRTGSPTSAGREVWQCEDVRKHILLFLEMEALATCLRVDTEAFCDAASLLYRDVGRHILEPFLGSTETRHLIYCAAVQKLTVLSNKLIPGLERALRLDLPDGDQAEEAPSWDGDSDSAITFNALTMCYRSACPNLRRLAFVERDGGPGERSWTLHLDPARVPVDLHDNTFDPSPTNPLRIDIMEYRTYYYSHAPPKSIAPRLKPSDSIIISFRFNFTMGHANNTVSHTPAQMEDWVRFIRESPDLGNLSTSLGLGEIPVEFATVISICKRQGAAGHPDRLTIIEAPRVRRFRLRQFRRFAEAASTSLGQLVLAQEARPAGTPIKDLPDLFAIVSTHLPNLIRLDMAVSKSDVADQLARRWLEPDTLEQVGKIRLLGLYVDSPDAPLLNFVRYLSRWTSRGGLVLLEDLGTTLLAKQPWVRYLRYLRSYLSTADFATLDITTPAQVLELEYEDDGRPIRRLRSQAKGWSSMTSDIKGRAIRTLFPDIGGELAELEEAASHFKAVSVSAAPPSEVKRELGVLAEQVTKAKEAAERLSVVLQTIQNMEEDVKNMAEVMRVETEEEVVTEEAPDLA